MNRRLLHPALRLLMRLQLQARLRRLKGACRTWKGRLVLLIGLALGGLWIVGTALSLGAGRVTPDPATIRSLAAMGLAGLTLMTVLFGGTQGGIPFPPAEVEFLFPAPISRRQLLLYRIIRAMLIGLPSALLFSFALARQSPMWLGAFAGIWFAFQLIGLTQMVWQLMLGIAREATAARSRRLILIAAVGLAGLVVATSQASPELSVSGLRTFAESVAGRIILAPFRPFTAVLTATSTGELLRSGAVCASILGGLVAIILRLDRNFMEAAVSASERATVRLADARRGKLVFHRGNRFLIRYRAPRLPRMGGAGPIAWNQLTSLIRSAGSVALVAGIASAGAMMPTMFGSSPAAGQLLPMAIGMSLVLLPQFLQYDFRSELDRMPVLKALPLRPVAIVLGELLTPVLLTTCLQAAMLVVLAVAGTIPGHRLLVVAGFLLPANLLIYGAENFAFLLYPFRVAPSNTPDLQSMLRVALTTMLKLAILALAAGTAAGLGGLTYLASGRTDAAIATAWIGLWVVFACMVPGIAWAFSRFDPATDTPA